MDEKFSSAVKYAVKQLTYRALSRKRLKEKLEEKGYDEEAASYALERLEELRLLDDKSYAESVVRSYSGKGYGAVRIRFELKNKGVNEEDAEAAMTGYEPNNERIKAFLDKRLRGDFSDRKEVQKAIAALSRRGFSYSEIKDAFSETEG